MNLLNRLRETFGGETSPTHDDSPQADTYEVKGLEGSKPVPAYTDYESFGVGASMPQDIANFHFQESCRRIIPDLHEFPPNGLPLDGMEFADS